MHPYTAVIERCPDTNLYVGYACPASPARTAKARLHANLREVIAMLLGAA